jgi:hypothetical protein
VIAEHLHAVACPTCHAEVGKPCRTYRDHRTATVHVARQNLVHRLQGEDPDVNHTHDLDGKLHDGCAMCDEIRRLTTRVKLEGEVDRMVEKYTDLASKPKEP